MTIIDLIAHNHNNNNHNNNNNNSIIINKTYLSCPAGFATVFSLKLHSRANNSNVCIIRHKVSVFNLSKTVRYIHGYISMFWRLKQPFLFFYNISLDTVQTQLYRWTASAVF